MDVKYRIRGSGIRGYNHTKNKWPIKKNTCLEVKLEIQPKGPCLNIYTVQGADAGKIPAEFQTILRSFLEAESAKIEVKVTSMSPVTKVKIRGPEIPCDIFLTGKDTHAVMNPISRLKQEIKDLKKKNTCYKGLKMAKMPVKKKIAGNVRPEDAAGDASNVNDEILEEEAEADDEINAEDGTNDRQQLNSVADGANHVVDDRNVRPELIPVADRASNWVDDKFGRQGPDSVADGAKNRANDKFGSPELNSVADGANNAYNEQNTNSSNNFCTKRKQISKDNSQTDEPIPKIIKTTEPSATTSATQSQHGVTDENTPIHIRVIRKNWSQFLQDLDPPTTLDSFTETEYITTIEARDIRELKSTSDKIREILCIVQRKGPKGYHDFKSCLRKSNQEHLATILENTEEELTKERSVFPDALQ